MSITKEALSERIDMGILYRIELYMRNQPIVTEAEIQQKFALSKEDTTHLLDYYRVKGIIKSVDNLPAYVWCFEPFTHCVDVKINSRLNIEDACYVESELKNKMTEIAKKLNIKDYRVLSRTVINKLPSEELAGESSPILIVAATGERVDPLCEKVLRFWLERNGGKASIASIQRNFAVGFIRAACIMEILQSLGYVSCSAPNDASTTYSKVLISLNDLNGLFVSMDPTMWFSK